MFSKRGERLGNSFAKLRGDAAVNRNMTLPGMAELGESAFVNNTPVPDGKPIGGRKANEASEIHVQATLAAVDTILQPITPSERRSAESVFAIKGPLAGLKVPLSADAKKQRRLLQLGVPYLTTGRV